MVNRKKKGKYIGMAGALVVHVAIIALLILVGFTPPEPSEEGGVPVMLGELHFLVSHSESVEQRTLWSHFNSVAEKVFSHFYYLVLLVFSQIRYTPNHIRKKVYEQFFHSIFKSQFQYKS